MKTFKILYILPIALLITISCEQEVITLEPPAPVVVTPPTGTKGSADFTKFVAIGNSLTAGYQSGALFNEGQQNSLPLIMSKQFSIAQGTTIAFNQPAPHLFSQRDRRMEMEIQLKTVPANPDNLAAMLEPLASGNADFTLGSRTLGSAVNLPLSRKFILKAATLFSRISLGAPLTDTHNGIRGMTRRGAGFINLRHNRMAHASEILGQIVRSGLTFVEVPVTVKYSSYSLKKGQKTIEAVRILAELAAGRVRR